MISLAIIADVASNVPAMLNIASDVAEGPSNIASDVACNVAKAISLAMSGTSLAMSKDIGRYR